MVKNTMPTSQSLFGSSGIRGKVNETITGPLAIRIGLATAHVLRSHHKAPQIMVGHDHRITSPMLTSALMAGLLQGGVPVTQTEMAPTPSIAFAAGKEGLHRPAPEARGEGRHRKDCKRDPRDDERIRVFSKCWC